MSDISQAIDDAIARIARAEAVAQVSVAIHANALSRERVKAGAPDTAETFIGSIVEINEAIHGIAMDELKAHAEKNKIDLRPDAVPQIGAGAVPDLAARAFTVLLERFNSMQT